MSELLRYTMFYDVLFPPTENSATDQTQRDLMLHQLIRFHLADNVDVRTARLVIFDFETTGLDAREDRIIEIGAQKIEGGKVVDEFSTLINPEMKLTKIATSISGITEEMLVGMPKIGDVLPKFLQFMEGAILVAHNAEFDFAFLAANCHRLGYDLDWPCFCTLKLARLLLPQLESKNLDSLAAHYQLQFEARHRSIGDVKVTHGVLNQMLGTVGQHLKVWKDLQPIAGVRD